MKVCEIDYFKGWPEPIVDTPVWEGQFNITDFEELHPNLANGFRIKFYNPWLQDVLSPKKAPDFKTHIIVDDSQDRPNAKLVAGIRMTSLINGECMEYFCSSRTYHIEMDDSEWAALLWRTARLLKKVIVEQGDELDGE